MSAGPTSPLRPAGPRLPPRVHPTVRGLLDRPGLLPALTDRWGSPLHLVAPSVMAGNVAAFRAVLERAGVRARIFWAHKANQAAALAAAAERAGIGIDVASPGELRSALDAGFTADRIEVTGPKGRAFLEQIVAAGCCVNIDNPWELEQVVALARDRRRDGGEPVRVLVRLAAVGNGAAGAGRRSRFGVPAREVPAVLGVLRAARDDVTFLGPSFHLDTGDLREKVEAVQQCLTVVEQAWRAGLTPGVVNVGGGFRQAFVTDTSGFDEYVAALRRGLLGHGPPLTWDGATLGYRIDRDGVRGVPEFHKYACTVDGSRSLADLLAAPLPEHGGLPVARVLADTLLELWVEPGKALVDHAGLTVATVQFTSHASDGSVLVTLDVSRDKVCPADQEVLLDPVVVPRHPPAPPPAPAPEPAGVGGGVEGGSGVGVFFAGTLCLERDLVLRHRVFLDSLPEPGDVVAFVNTAAYQMDLSASDALMHVRPRRLVVDVDPGSGRVRTGPDRGDPHEEWVWPSTTT